MLLGRTPQEASGSVVSMEERPGHHYISDESGSQNDLQSPGPASKSTSMVELDTRAPGQKA